MKNFLFLTFSFFLVFTSFSANAWSVDAKNIFHNPPDASTFKSPGIPFVIKAKLNGTRNVNHKIRMVAVIDGKAVDVASNQVYWDEYDRPVYDFEIFYPEHTLSYTFVMDEYSDLSHGARTISKKYVVNRICDFPTEVSDDETDPLQRVFDESNIEERNEAVMDELHKLVNWFNERVVNNENN